MLTQLEFDSWCSRLNLSVEAKEAINKIRASQPARKVGGGYKNVCGQFPSRKMGVSIQFESHKNELPVIYKLENDDSVLEYYDQPNQIVFPSETKQGAARGYLRTPDFFVICNDSAGWIECKTEKDLEKLQAKNPRRYCFGDDQKWHFPPGEAYATKMGLYFHVWSDSEINWVLYRNLIFLDDYSSKDEINRREEKELLIALVSENPGMSLTDLFRHKKNFLKDLIYSLIAQREIYIDLNIAPLVEPEKCLLFSNKEISIAYRISIDSMNSLQANQISQVKLQTGEKLIYGNKELTIRFVGSESVVLQDENQKFLEHKISEIELLITQGKIKVLNYQLEIPSKDEILECLIEASKDDLAIANMRFNCIQGNIEEGYSLETIRKWKRNFKLAEKECGVGLIGLLPKNHKKGNRTRKISEEKIVLMTQFIDQKHETFKQQTIKSVYGSFLHIWEEKRMSIDDAPSYKTFAEEVKKRPKYEQEMKRRGYKAAYKHQEFQYELNFSIPSHGDRPLEIGHIDHTELDLELRCSTTGKKLGRSWLTILIDANTRRILALYITFDPPSYRSCMMVIRICIQRHGRLPQIIVTDNGAEFHSIYYETLLIYLGSTIKYRPPSKSRFGAVCERLFGTCSRQLIYNLSGNTQITKDVRVTTKFNNPKELSTWNLGDLYTYLSIWSYEIYDQNTHSSLGITPQEAWQNGIEKFGSRDHKFIIYDQNLKILTMPGPRKGTAKARAGKGIRIQNIYYWANDFRDPELEGADVDVRYDPFDRGIAYAFLKGRWVECKSAYYSIFKGRSEKEIEMVSAEYRKRNERSNKELKLNALVIGNFLKEIEAEENFQKQRLKDLEAQQILEYLENPNGLLKIEKSDEASEEEILDAYNKDEREEVHNDVSSLIFQPMELI
ncbi:MAG: DDE-type integrase/transposase/recombinase [Nodosilinea sp. WJT8-NPBG4]|jgi:transposase InsO family protein|nr:DDE-type integrase/transposase/recombinase [Nodosilinea sp. WJT8-NPBG4]